MSPDDRERCARVRAARAYANLKQPELAKASGVGYATIKRVENEQRAPMLEELRAIADACKVPRPFLEHGFGTDGVDDVDVRIRLQNAETQLAALWATISRLDDRTRQLEADARERDKEALEREQELAAVRAETRTGSSASGQADRGARG